MEQLMGHFHGLASSARCTPAPWEEAHVGRNKGTGRERKRLVGLKVFQNAKSVQRGYLPHISYLVKVTPKPR